MADDSGGKRVIIAIDTETYRLDETSGKHVPILDCRAFYIGCAMTDDGRKEFFTDRIKMLDWQHTMIEKNNQRRRRTSIYASEIGTAC